MFVLFPLSFMAAQVTQPDLSTPEKTVAALYDVISGGKGVKRDWDRFKSLFKEEGRMMGGGFGGCSINLVEKGSEKELIEKISEQYRSQFGIDLKAYKVKISKGTTEYK